jgi:tetratricopeptide (TPR) repeat protein
MNTKRFRIAFSFAGEKRDFVKQVADLLALRFGQDRILYDKYHEMEFAVFDLGIKLPKLYGEQSDLIVPVLCPDYDAKRWTGWEWVHIYGLLTKADGHRVIPSRFGYANADGLSPASGFIELDRKTPDEFVSLILERLALNEGHSKDHYTKPAVVFASTPKSLIPHNLPSLQPFFGREDELKKIADALDPDSRTWGALIDGPAGVGKTSLAVRAAYSASPEAFDKIVFISLKWRELDDDGVRDLSGFLVSGLVELFGELARELGRDDIVKAAEDQRPRLLIDALRGTQTLLVLDNLESLLKPERDILFTFVKKLPAGCKAILTSRGRIGSGAEELILEKLGEQAALDTLAELATHNPHLARTSDAERRVLYRETGGKPLLLRWIAGQLGRGHCLSFTAALDFLRSCPPGNDALEFIFGDLVDEFNETETKALCALTYFTQPVEVEHIAAICDLTESATDRALRSLVSRSLVVPADELTVFSLVPMIADFLRRKKPDVVAEAGDRLEQRAYALIIENGDQNYDRFPALEVAWPSIAAALERFLAGDNSRLQSVCVALQVFLEFQGRWDEWLALTEKAEVRAVAAADYESAGWRAYQAGCVYYLNQQAEAVFACADRAAAHWANANAGARGHATAIRLRGHGHQLNADFTAAIAAYRDALDLYRSRPVAKSTDVAIFLSDLAGAEQSSGDYFAAEAHYTEALRVASSADDAHGIAVFTSNLADLALAREDWSAAEVLAREALPLSEAISQKSLIASNNRRIALALMRTGKADQALPYIRRAVDIFTNLGDAAEIELARATLRECDRLTSCLYVDNIEIKNIRPFESLTLQLSDSSGFPFSNIILGENAAGKSTLLRCIAVGLCNEPDATALLTRMPGEFIRKGAQEGFIRIGLRRSDGSKLFSITTRIVKVDGSGGTGESARQTTDPKTDFPWEDIFLCGYGTSRVAGGSASHDMYNSGTAVASLFDERASLWNPEVALLRRQPAIREEMERRLLQALMLDSAQDGITSEHGQPMVHGPWGATTFEVLSDGYRSTSQWLLDFMAWAILADRFGGHSGVRGVLLIDELEQHLHPRWQRHIMQRLHHQFPGAQIIATTHTPLIVAGTVDIVHASVSHLDANSESGAMQLTMLNKEHLRGKRADQILASSAFGLPTSRSPGNTNAVQRYTELQGKRRTYAEDDELKKLLERLNFDLEAGESEYERAVERAVNEALEHRLKQPPSQTLSLEVKRKLRELFGDRDSND